MYQIAKFPLTEQFKLKALRWGNGYTHAALFNPNGTKQFPFDAFKHFMAVGEKSVIQISKDDHFEQLESAIKNTGRWLIGHLSYDLKNQIEKLESNHQTPIDFPVMSFFEADHLIFFLEEDVEIYSVTNPKTIYQKIIAQHIGHAPNLQIGKIHLETSRETYINTVKQLIEHIAAGDIYEINYCINYSIDRLSIDPVAFYKSLCDASPTPFSVFYKHNQKYALGASPERFLKKTDDLVISQPIKGTAKRGKNEREDLNIIASLKNDEKERAENMMIVDLVRNDLARSAQTGTVKVEEIFGIYSYKHWHQMISTVSAKLRPEIRITDVLKNAFPMGSMTGAPKIKVMQLIEQYETFKRGLYAGAIGYITPDKDFDFNVVIRTLFYDQLQSTGTFMVGSAITYDAIAEKEYDECVLKAKAIIETLQQLG